MSTALPTESGFLVHHVGQIPVEVIKTPGGRENTEGVASTYDVHHPKAQVELRLVSTPHGERWVEARNVRSFLRYLPRLEGRLRLTIDSQRSFSTCALRLAAPKGESWANLRDASLAELGEAAGVAVGRELRGVGALEVGTKGAILGETGRTRKRLIATFPDDNEHVPVLAFVLTRLAPLVRASLATAQPIGG
ncbi:MAG TPA: hypothetical protein VNK94_13475 [Gaiellaceae bacterium]|jgi:hypothetical protein|nr:hypothetical protein [Gaiellaceae bacterium]